MSSRPLVEPSGLRPAIDEPEASRRTAAVILALGVAFDLSFNGQRPGVSIPLFVIALAFALRAPAYRSMGTDILLVAASVFSVFPALRASEPLVALDLLAVTCLLGLAVTEDVASFATAGIRGLMRRAISIFRRALAVPRFLLASFSLPRSEARARWRATAKIVAITVLILATFAALLASGDRVFGRFLGTLLPDWDVGGAAGHLTLTVVGACLVALLWRVALGDGGVRDEQPESGRAGLLSSTEAVVVLAAVVALFTTFVVIQFAYLFGGGNRVDVTPGLTYAEYARSGFFQLAAAAVLTVGVILGAWDFVRRDDDDEERTFRWLVTGLVALTGVVLASALKRLALYEGTFGFTINRFFGYVAICGIGGVLLVTLAALWTRRRDLVVGGILAAVLTALLVVNIMNPERFVATRNVARFEAIGRIDVDYLGWGLGADAVPVAAALLGRLPIEQRDTLASALCERLETLGPEPSWRSDNAGRRLARDALRRAGIDAAGCSHPPSA